MPRRALGATATTGKTGSVPTFQRIPSEQLARYFSGANEIGALLREMAPGEGGLINVKNLDVRVVKRQYTLAAKPLGWTLQWGEVTPDAMLPFMVAPAAQIGTTTNGDSRHQSTETTVRLNRGKRPAPVGV